MAFCIYQDSPMKNQSSQCNITSTLLLTDGVQNRWLIKSKLYEVTDSCVRAAMATENIDILFLTV